METILDSHGKEECVSLRAAISYRVQIKQQSIIDSEQVNDVALGSA
jgi:hypothetical protein